MDPPKWLCSNDWEKIINRKSSFLGGALKPDMTVEWRSIIPFQWNADCQPALMLKFLENVECDFIRSDVAEI